MGARILPVETHRDPQRSSTTWTQGDSWEPKDNPNLALDPDREWYDEVVEGPVTAEPWTSEPDPKSLEKLSKKRKRSVRSVSKALLSIPITTDHQARDGHMSLGNRTTGPSTSMNWSAVMAAGISGKRTPVLTAWRAEPRLQGMLNFVAQIAFSRTSYARTVVADGIVVSLST